MSLKFILPIVATVALVGCETTYQSGGAQQGSGQSAGAYGADAYPQGRDVRYINKAYGNCGHCMGNTGR